MAATGVVAAAAMAHALTSRAWVGLEAVLVWPLRIGVVGVVGLSAVLAAGLLRGRRWARLATAVTSVVVAAAAGAATVDAAQRATGSGLVAPVLLLALALVVLVALAKSPSEASDPAGARNIPQ